MRAACQAVIFDLDGTLVDSLRDIATLMNETLAAHALPTHPVEAYARFVGGGVSVLAERATAGIEVEITELTADFLSRYRREPLRHTRPYEGIAALLTVLRERPLRLAVLSNKPHDLTRAITFGLFGEETFAAVLGHRDAFPKKPDPTTALALAKQLSAPPEACVFVGDTDIDVHTATRAGMRPVGVSWGFRPTSELLAAGAELVIEHPAELLSLVL